MISSIKTIWKQKKYIKNMVLWQTTRIQNRLTFLFVSFTSLQVVEKRGIPGFVD
jgi:hypothetical protein